MTRSWGTASANARAAAVSILAGGGSQAGWEATAAPVDPEAVASPVRFAAPAPVVEAEPTGDFADDLLEAVYGRRPRRDNTGGRIRPYGDDDAAWWAAERAARDRAEEAARIVARYLESRAQEALDAGLWFDPAMEMSDHARMTEAAEAGLRI